MSVIVFALAVLTLLAVPFVERGSAAYVIMLINTGYFVVLFGIIFAFRIKCGTER